MAAATEATCPLCGSGDAPVAYRGTDLLHGGEAEYEYRDCTSCGAVFQAPMPDAKSIRGFYPDDYVAYRPERPKAPRSLERAVLRARYGYTHLAAPAWARLLAPLAGLFAYRRALPFVEGGRLLDVGCGSGKFLLAMRDLGWGVAGVDMDPRAVAACRAQGLEVSEGGVEAADGNFHCVTARHVIEHVPDPDGFAGGLARLLRPGGRLHLRTPNAAALGRRRYGALWYANDIPRHLVLYAPSTLETLLARHGLRRLALRTRSTPKILLNSRDNARDHRGTPSRYRALARLKARPAVWWSQWVGRGYEIVADYQKPA